MTTMEKYRHLNIKLTPQRLAILGYLEGNKSHQSADDIFKSVSIEFPTMSFATVYNTLEALKNKDNILELKIDPAKKRYDPETIPHHHLICTNCKTILDVFNDFNLDLSTDLTDGFDVTGNHIEFFGKCSTCK